MFVCGGGVSRICSRDGQDHQKTFLRARLPIVSTSGFFHAIYREAPRVARNVERSSVIGVYETANTGSSVALPKHTAGELVEGLLLAAEFDRKVLVEQGIAGVREIECGVLGNADAEASCRRDRSSKSFTTMTQSTWMGIHVVIPAGFRPLSAERSGAGGEGVCRDRLPGMAARGFFVTKGRNRVCE